MQETTSGLRRRVEAEIERRLDDPTLSVAGLAAALGISRSGLHRQLVRGDGRPPGRMIRHARLLRAADLLRHTDDAISGIARQVGYEDPAHFTRSFKRKFGLPPSTFRSRGGAEPG